MNEALRKGHYARKQLFCKDGLISWSHRRRFEMALRLIRESGGRRMLDYGCGDGTLLTMALDRDASCGILEAVGAEVGLDQIDDCRRRLGALNAVSFVAIHELDADRYRAAFDLVLCTEVLEHVVDRQCALNRFRRVLAPGGHLIVSVPVETGFPLLIKQIVRTIAGWRGLGDYPGIHPYSWGDLRRSIFASEQQHIIRPVHGAADGHPFHDHKGFNWKVLRTEISMHFDIQRILTSPLSSGGAQLASQIWFVARQRGL